MGRVWPFRQWWSTWWGQEVGVGTPIWRARLIDLWCRISVGAGKAVVGPGTDPYVACVVRPFLATITGGSQTAAARSVETVAIYMYIEAFSKNRWGSAAAIGVILLVLTLIFSVVLMRVTKRETYEY